MSQPALFHESIIDAIREVVQALGGAKVVGARMRPDLPPDHAGRWLADCLSHERREKLSPDQVLWMGREGRHMGCHAIARYLMSDWGYAEPQPVEPEDERARLQREYIDAARAMSRMAERIERLTLPAGDNAPGGRDKRAVG